MSENVCCPYFAVLGCADTDEHKHVACLGSLDDGPGLTNEVVEHWCLDGFRNCPWRPRGEDRGVIG